MSGPAPHRPGPGTTSPWVHRLERVAGAAHPGGSPGGPLAGTSLGVKDLVAVAGLPLGAGSRARAGRPAERRDAGVVSRLRAGGATVVGTLALHELAFGVTGINDQVGFPRNPVDPGRIPGGSSSGSAVAVATGECELAVGTDTGGSVRIPAALCGVVGFKPSRGRYPVDGVLPLSPTLDHVGLLAAAPHPVVVAHQVLTGEAVAPAPPTRLGVDRSALEAAAGPVATAVEHVLDRLAGAGTDLVEVDWPDHDRVREVSTTIMFAEAAQTHRELLGGPPDLLGADVAGRLRTGAGITAAAHREALAAGTRIEEEVRATLAGVDAVAGPTVPVTAPTVEEARADPDLAAGLVSCTRLANVAGVAALSLPVPAGAPPGAPALPVGLQLVAGSDAGALGIGLWFHPR